MISEPRMYVRHLRQSRTCMKNSRMWFAARGWSWSEFLRDGRPVSDFEETGDALALPAIAAAKAEASDGRG